MDNSRFSKGGKNMRYLISLILLLSLNLNAQVGPLPNGGLEKGLEGWAFSGTSMAVVDVGRNTEGKQSLRMSTGMNSGGSSILSPTFNFNDFRTGTCVGTFDHIVWASGQSTNFYATLNDGSGNELNSAWRQTVIAQPTEAVATYKFIFPCRPDVRFRFVSNGSGNANNNIDNVKFEVAKDVEVANVTSWMTYTPTITASSGSLTNFSLTGTEYMRAGSSIFIKGTLTFTGSVGTWSRPRISLPTGMVIDNTAPATMSGVLLNDNGSNRYGSDVTLTQGTSFVQIESYRGSSGVLVDPTQAAPFGWTSGDSISWTIGPIKIVGLASSSTVINAACPSVGQCEDLFTADVNTSGTITNQTPTNWLTSCTSFAPSVCTFVTNHFSVTPKCWAATTASATASFGFDTTYSGTTSVTMDRKDEMGARRSINYTLFCRRATTDFKGKRVLQADISNMVKSDTGTRLERVSFHGASAETNCTSSPCVIQYKSSGVSSVTRQGTGEYRVNFSPNFTAPPSCTGAFRNNSAVIVSFRAGTAPTKSYYQIAAFVAGGGAADSYGDIVCVGK